MKTNGILWNFHIQASVLDKYFVKVKLLRELVSGLLFFSVNEFFDFPNHCVHSMKKDAIYLVSSIYGKHFVKLKVLIKKLHCWFEKIYFGEIKITEIYSDHFSQRFRKINVFISLLNYALWGFQEIFSTKGIASQRVLHNSQL